jgi:UV excision repair protein RAD23
LLNEKSVIVLWVNEFNVFWFTGKILTDESVLSEYNIDEKKFIVVMVTKPKSTPAPYAGPSDPTAAPEQTEEGKQQEENTVATGRLV